MELFTDFKYFHPLDIGPWNFMYRFAENGTPSSYPAGGFPAIQVFFRPLENESPHRSPAISLAHQSNSFSGNFSSDIELPVTQ
ncbi:MAG TPA: hypothetical protein VL978_15530 [Puia sp.]|nr:hypothetical protein [Puia sp.]